MNRTRIAIVGLALLATACTGGGNTSGTPTPGTPTETQSPTSSGNAAGDGKLASTKPCELISNSEAGQLGIPTSGEARKTGGRETCEWIGTGNGITVVLYPNKGADDLNYEGSNKAPGKYGKYDGYKVPAPDGAKNLCDIVLSVSQSESVSVSGGPSASSTDTTAACELVTKSAELVAAKL